MKLILLSTTSAFLSLATSLAGAAVMHFSAPLAGADEVPANTTAGTGEVVATLDTDSKAFAYTVTYSGLTGPGVAAHFHGPAGPGVNAPPVIMVAMGSSPMSGKMTLSDAQVADLNAGKWYLNIHTSAHPGGEVRGQLKMMMP